MADHEPISIELNLTAGPTWERAVELGRAIASGGAFGADADATPGQPIAGRAVVLQQVVTELVNARDLALLAGVLVELRNLFTLAAAEIADTTELDMSEVVRSIFEADDEFRTNGPWSFRGGDD